MQPVDQLLSVRSGRLRLILGLAQMGGATFSAVVLICSGVNRASLGGVIVTTILTSISVLLFGSRPPDHRRTGAPSHSDSR